MKYIKTFEEFVNESSQSLQKDEEIKFRGELRWDRLKDGTFSRFISGGTYIVGDIIDGEVELFSKSRKRFEKAGTRHVVPIDVLKKRLKISESINEGVDKWVIENDKGLYFNYYFKKFTSKLNKFSTYKDEEWAKRDADKHGGEVKKLGK